MVNRARKKADFPLSATLSLSKPKNVDNMIKEIMNVSTIIISYSLIANHD
jgi:hypothetical protein